MAVYNRNLHMNKDEKRMIFHYTGFVLLFLGLFMIIPLLCAVGFQDLNKYIYAFGVSLGICFSIGFLLYFGLKPTEEYSLDLSFKGSLIFVTAIWFVVAFFAALPFYISGDLSFIDAIYESMSGITTTGYTLYSSTLIYPYSIAIWKCLIQWLGGLGIIVILIGIVPSSSLKRLYAAEGRAEQITPNIRHTTKILFEVYLVLTTIGILLYLLVGLDLFDAICYTFAAIATGGFSINPLAVQYFSNPVINFVTIIIMLLGATNFLIHYKVVKGDWRLIFKDIEFKAMVIFIVAATILISLNLYSNGYYGSNIFSILNNTIFTVVSVITSTGFQSTSIDYWTPFSYQILILLMFTGSSMCSTAGGIKMYNVVILFQSIKWQMEDMILPTRTVVPHKIYHDKYQTVDNKEIKIVVVFVMIYILVFVVSVIAMLLFTNNYDYAVITVASSLGNTGLGPTFITTDSHMAMKIICIIDFWIGRIAVWPVLIGLVYFTNSFRSLFNSYNVKLSNYFKKI